MRIITIFLSAIVGAAILSSPVFAQQKTVKACREEWQANKTENQAKKITEKAYIAQCRSDGAASAVTPAATPAPASKSTTAPTAAPKPAAKMAPAPSGANEFSTEAQAKARCGSGTVVWVNSKSKIYHFAGHKDYGNTKSGTYMCETDATGAGNRAAKNEKHP